MGGAIMINAADFLKWLAVFNIPIGGGGGGGVSAAQVQRSAFNFSLATGVDDAFIVTLNPAAVSLTDGLLITMVTTTLTNLTTTPTLQVNSLTPKQIISTSGEPLIAGDIAPDTAYIIVYNAQDDNFQLINPSISNADAYLVQKNYFNYAIDIGTTNAYEGNLPVEPLVVITNGNPYTLLIGNTNTGASTLSINGSTATSIVNQLGNTLTGGEIQSGSYSTFIYSSAFEAYVLTNPYLTSGSGGNAARYVVSSVPGQAEYTTIQAAINQAVVDSPSSTTQAQILVWPGTYIEDLSLANNVNISALAANNSVIIEGTPTCNIASTVTFQNLNFIGENGFTVNGSGNCTVNLLNCTVTGNVGTGFYCSNPNATNNVVSTTITAGSNGAPLDMQAGILNFINGSVFMTVFASDFTAGSTSNFYNSQLNDAFLNQGAMFISNCYLNSIGEGPDTFSCITITDGGSCNVINTTLASNATSSYVIDTDGTAVLFTSNITTIGSAIEINLASSVFIQAPTLVGNLSFDGGQSILGSDGQLWIGSSTGQPKPMTLAAGANVTITNTANAIEISAAGASLPVGISAPLASQSMVSGNIYIADYTGGVTQLVLPVTAAYGTQLEVLIGVGSNFEIAQNSGQSIGIGNLVSTTGVSGSITSTDSGDNLSLICIETNTKWRVYGGIGQLNVA
jgi:hypothetical protein